MNAGQMIAAVSLAVQDDSFASADILAELNAAVDEVAGLYPLLALQTQADIVFATGDMWASLPADYHRDAYDAYSATRRCPIRIRANRRVLEHEYWDHAESAKIDDVAIEAGRIWVRPIPDATDRISLQYYRHPTPMSSATDTPEGIPVHLQDRLIVSRAIARLFALIEQGTEGAKVDTDYYDKKWTEGLGMLSQFTPTPSRQQPYVRRHARFF